MAGIIATVTVFAVAQGLTYPLLSRCSRSPRVTGRAA